MNDGEEPPVKGFLMLPDDLILNCLARVAKFYYPTLSLVSKRFRSLLASTELSQTRTLLGRTDSHLYVCLRLRTYSNQLHWFNLHQRPNSSRVLVPIPSPTSSSDSLSGVAVVGPNIYAIGGGRVSNASSSVMVMDTRSHTWHEAPSMRVPRVFPSACTFDGKIYVMGGCHHLDSTNWMEVFDTKTQTWEFLEIPSEEICRGSEYESARYEGTVYVRSEAKNVTYKLHKGRWRSADLAMNTRWSCSGRAYCVIENVFYSFGDRNIFWYDPKARVSTTLKGLEGLPRHSKSVRLADHGGKLVIFWDEYVVVDRKIMIWCMEIAIEKRQNGEIWGTVEWVGSVFTYYGTNGLLDLVHALSSTVW